jgi:predicted nucleic acid-binding protein
MRVIVSDSSCLIDLRKASLLDAFVKLPYELLIPNTLFEDELLKFTASQKNVLLRGGVKVMDMPGERVMRALEVVRQVPRLSINDGFAFALAEQHEGCVLLSGDGALRAHAASCAIEVRGVLWVNDELYRNGIAPVPKLLDALALFADDKTVRLPGREIAAAVETLSGSEVSSRPVERSHHLKVISFRTDGDKKFDAHLQTLDNIGKAPS